jgi:hypothetical protein
MLNTLRRQIFRDLPPMLRNPLFRYFILDFVFTRYPPRSLGDRFSARRHRDHSPAALALRHE